MMLRNIFIAFLLVFFSGLQGQEFSVMQKTWLYRIVMKTPLLKENWSDSFLYKGDLPLLHPGYYNGVYKENLINWPLYEENVLHNPDLLRIDFESLKSSSPGLLAEVSVKLTFWELYSECAEVLNNENIFDSINKFPSVVKEMFNSLPELMKNGETIKKKYEPVFIQIINPSLSIAKKVDALSSVKGLSLLQQKKIMDNWHMVVKEYVSERSLNHFKQLTGRNIYFQGDLLAAGEGSGSSGLLKEYEIAGDKPIQTGNGKGIGFFTYEMQTKRDKLVPKIESEIVITPLKDEPTLLHLSLWGMDSNKKPLILIQRDSISYLLFADFKTDLLSPDDALSPGISYLDRINEFEEKEIVTTLKDLEKPGGLLSVYQREDSLKSSIQKKISAIEMELDSLNKTMDVSQAAIDQRKRRIDTYLTNLSDKEERLQDINRKISGEYVKVDKSRQKLSEMKSVLGSDIQGWTKKDSLYLFDDGTYYNFKTQDLIFNSDSSHENKITVKLLAASYSLKSKLKDEVQLYVNTTGGVGNKKEKKEKHSVSEDSLLLRKSFFFQPDEYNINVKNILSDSLLHYCRTKKIFTLELNAMGVDSSLLDKTVNTYALLKNDSSFVHARRVDLVLKERDDTVIIKVCAFTDNGNTRLSKTGKEEYNSVKDLHLQVQSFNPGLSVLRLVSVVRQLEEELNQDFSTAKIQVVPIQKEIRMSEFGKKQSKKGVEEKELGDE